MLRPDGPPAILPTAARTERLRPRQRPAATARWIEFARVNRAAIVRLPDILARWLPGGQNKGSDYVALNPRRVDRRPGSFKVSLDTGRWADFATGDKGGDPISLGAY